MRDLVWQGCIDFTRFDPRDDADARRLEWLLLAAEETRTERYFQESLRSTEGVLSRTSPDSPRRQVLAENIVKLRKAYVRNLLPWLNSDEADEVDLKDMRGQWVQAFGDPNDPAIAAEIERTAAWLNKNS